MKVRLRSHTASSRLAFVLGCAALAGPALASNIGDPWPIPFPTAFTSQGYAYNFSFYGVADGISDVQPQAVPGWTLSYTLSQPMGGCVHLNGGDGPSGNYVFGASGSQSDPLLVGAGFSLSTGGPPNTTSSASATGNPFFIYKVTTQGPDGYYAVIFAHGSRLTAQGTTVGPGTGGTADASNMGWPCHQETTFQGRPGTLGTVHGVNGGPVYDGDLTQKFKITNGVGYVFMNIPLQGSCSSSNPGQGMVSVDEELRPKAITTADGP